MSSRHIRGPLVYVNTTVQTAAGNVSVVNESVVIVNKGTGAATTVNLPASPVTGRSIVVKDGKGDAATNNITVTPAAGTIDGASTHVIAENYGSATYTYNGTQWNVTTHARPASASLAGAVAGSNTTALEIGSGPVQRTILTFAAQTFALTDEAGVVAYAGSKVYDFPAGGIVILGAVADLDLTKSSAGVNADWDGDFSVGTVTASNNNTLSSTEANIIPSTATPQAVAGVTTANGLNTAAVFLDGTGTAADVFLNFLVDDADHNVAGTACNLIVSGTLTLTWIPTGDF